MSSIVSEAVGSVKVGVRSASRRFVKRLRVLEQAGQDVLEYAGMLVVVAFVIVGLFTLPIGSAIEGGIASAYNAVFQTSHTYTPPSPVTPPAVPSGTNGAHH